MPKNSSKKKKQKKPKKESRRSQQSHPDLDPRYNLKTRIDLIDQDYISKLSPKELEYLNKFNKEFVNASLDSESPRKNLHRNKALRKDCYDRNNSRNRDVLTRAKASNQLEDFETLLDKGDLSYEDMIINELDKKEINKAIDWLSEELDKDENILINNLLNEKED